MPGKLPSNRLFSQCLLSQTVAKSTAEKLQKIIKLNLMCSSSEVARYFFVCFNLLQIYDHLKYGV